MINLNDKVVNTPVVAKGILPEDTYKVVVDRIDAWKETVKDTLVNKRDDRGKVLKDDNGNIIRELVKNLSFHTANVVLKITDGTYKGRLIYTNITTHPNTKFITDSFLRALDKTDLTYNDIQKACVGLTLSVKTKNRTYDKITTNPDTGLDELTTKTATDVDRFL